MPTGLVNYDVVSNRKFTTVFFIHNLLYIASVETDHHFTDTVSQKMPIFLFLNNSLCYNFPTSPRLLAVATLPWEIQKVILNTIILYVLLIIYVISESTYN